MPDLMSSDFEEWCDYVARDDCARLRDDPNAYAATSTAIALSACTPGMTRSGVGR